ncbi:MAG: type II toxin-antitoxin system Phd/YefM family antitoxin [Alphaproteobacteria bacterium]
MPSGFEDAQTPFYGEGHIAEAPVQVNMHQAKTQLSKLIEMALKGQEVVIARNGTPVVKLVPVAKPELPPRKPGSLKGQIWIAPDFDDTPEDLIDEFYNNPIFPDEKPDEQE